MFRSLRKSLAILFVVATGAVVNGPTAEATVLPFDMTLISNGLFPGFILGGYESTYASYGDNVTATSMPGPGVNYIYGMGNGFTPDITVDYSHSALQAPSDGHTLTQPQGLWSDPVDYLHYIDTTQFWYTFTPSGPVGVDVNSFSIDLYSGIGNLSWNLRQDSIAGPIFASGTELALHQNDPDRIVNIADGSYYGTVVLEIIITGTGNAGNIGLDDLNFDQLAVPAPEPTTGLLLALGGFGLMTMRKRKLAARS